MGQRTQFSTFMAFGEALQDQECFMSMPGASHSVHSIHPRDSKSTQGVLSYYIMDIWLLGKAGAPGSPGCQTRAHTLATAARTSPPSSPSAQRHLALETAISTHPAKPGPQVIEDTSKLRLDV